jgi:hypothetical protein
MFELLDLILNSPIGAAILAGLQDSLYALIVLSDCDECGFNDLGTLLFGGLVLAVLVGVALSILLRRMKVRDSATSGFVSIRSSDRRE